MTSLWVCLLLRELELQRKSSATDIAKKKQEAESAVSTHARKQSYLFFCVHYWSLLVGSAPLTLSKNFSPILILLSSTPPPSCLSPSAPLQVLLMQESVRRIIEAEESKMGKTACVHANIQALHQDETENFFCLVWAVNWNFVKNSV